MLTRVLCVYKLYITWIARGLYITNMYVMLPCCICHIFFHRLSTYASWLINIDLMLTEHDIDQPGTVTLISFEDNQMRISSFVDAILVVCLLVGTAPLTWRLSKRENFALSYLPLTYCIMKLHEWYDLLCDYLWVRTSSARVSIRARTHEWSFDGYERWVMCPQKTPWIRENSRQIAARSRQLPYF